MSRLREVRALTGFTRIVPTTDENKDLAAAAPVDPVGPRGFPPSRSWARVSSSDSTNGYSTPGRIGSSPARTTWFMRSQASLAATL